MRDLASTTKQQMSLDQIVHPDTVYVPRVAPAAASWVPHKSAADQEAFTGGCLLVAGQIPVLCNAAVATAAILDLLSDAGHDIAPQRMVYRDFLQMNGILRDLVAEDRLLMLQHSWPSSMLPPDAKTLIAPELQSYLNDKASLDDLVPAHGRPQRQIMTPAAARENPPNSPVVVKVSTPLSTGAGEDIAVCTTPDEVARAVARFGTSERLIFEELLDIKHNLCVQGAVMQDGSVRMLGGSIQVTDAQGRYRGNRFAHFMPLDKQAVALASQIIGRAAGMGYRGIAGIDVGVLHDGSVRAFDLNFRLNGSTAALLVLQRLKGNHIAPVMQLMTWRCRCSFADVIVLIRRWMEEGRLFPLSLFDPEAAGLHGEQPKISGLMLGSSWTDLAGLEQEMAAKGLYS